MTKFLYAGPPADYPTLGFSVTANGAILDGAVSSPAITVPPDARWSVYGGGSAETGISRYGNPSATPTAEVPTGYVLAYSDPDNTYVPTSPTSLVAALATDLASAYSSTLAAFKDAVIGEGFRPNGTVVRDGSGVITSMPVIYPDGSTGVYTLVTKDANGAVTAFTATTTGGPLGTKTATVTIPRDSSGQVTGAVTVAVA